MDEEKRKIERMASEGDLDAQRRLNILKLRMGEKFCLNKPAGITWAHFLKINGYTVSSILGGYHSKHFVYPLNKDTTVFCSHIHSTARAAWKCAKRHLYSEMKKTLLL